MEKITRGNFVCGYECKHVFQFENQPSLFQQILAYDDYDYDPTVFMTASKFAAPIKSIVLGKLHGPNPKLEFPNNAVKKLIGVGFHMLAERAKIEGYKKVKRERRVEMVIDGVKISGKFDLLFKKTDKTNFVVSDFKTTKSCNAMYDHPDHTCQLSINRLLVENLAASAGKPIKVDDTGVNFMIFTDWRLDDYVRRYEKEGDKVKYPSSPFGTFMVKLMDRETTLGFIKETVKQVQYYLTRPQSEMPQCDDTWKHCLRCREYCDGRDICTQFADWKIKNNWR